MKKVEELIIKIKEFYNKFTNDNNIKDIYIKLEELGGTVRKGEKLVEAKDRFLKIEIYQLPITFLPSPDDVMLVDFDKYDMNIWFEKSKSFIKQRIAYYMINGSNDSVYNLGLDFDGDILSVIPINYKK